MHYNCLPCQGAAELCGTAVTGQPHGFSIPFQPDMLQQYAGKEVSCCCNVQCNRASFLFPQHNIFAENPVRFDSRLRHHVLSGVAGRGAVKQLMHYAPCMTLTLTLT
jgi:hypothetical protein